MQVRTSLSVASPRLVISSMRQAAVALALAAATTGLGLGMAGAAVALAPTTQSLSLAAPDTQAQRYADAVTAFQTQRYSAAYGRFAALADEGHVPSALMALAMVRYSPMFGTEWSATPAQLRDWSLMALQDVHVASVQIASAAHE
jgi:hypothetical protein